MLDDSLTDIPSTGTFTRLCSFLFIILAFTQSFTLLLINDYELTMNVWRIGRGETANPILSCPGTDPYCSIDQGSARPMSAQHASGTPGTRTSGPSFTERVRDLASGRRSLTSLRAKQSTDGMTGESPETAPIPNDDNNQFGHIDREAGFKEKYFAELDISRPFNERILSVQAACEEIQLYSVDTLMAVWELTRDLVAVTAPLVSRKAGFDLLIASVGHAGLQHSERQQFLDMIIVPLPSANSNYQVIALRVLTQDGRFLAPFELQLIAFLTIRLMEVFDAALMARKLQRRKRSQEMSDPIGEEISLSGFLRLIEDILRRSPEAFRDRDLTILITNMIGISNKTTSPDDINRAVAIFELLIISNRMPNCSLQPCVEVLCAMAGISANPFGDVPSNCLSRILKSHYQQEAREVLVKFLSVEPRDRKPNVLRGAFLTIDYLLQMNGAASLPKIDMRSLYIAFRAVWPVSIYFTVESLRIVGRLLHKDWFIESLVTENWSLLEDALDYFAQLAATTLDTTAEPNTDQIALIPSSPLHRYYSAPWSKLRTNNEDLIGSWRDIASAFWAMWDVLDEKQRLLTSNILLILSPYVNDQVIDLIINYMTEKALIFPPNTEWVRRLQLLVDLILFDPSKSDLARCLVLSSLKKVHSVVQENQENLAVFDQISLQVFRETKDEDRLSFINVVADFAVSYAQDANIEIFDYVLETLTKHLSVQNIMGPSIKPQPQHDSTPNLITACLVRLFLHCLPRSALKTVKIYRVLVPIASDKQYTHQTRLTAIKLLARIRCDASHAIKIIPDTDSQSLAAALYRAEATAHRHTSFQTSTNRVSLNDDSQITRTGRTSVIGSSRTGRSRSTTRSASARDRISKEGPPSWFHGIMKGLPDDPVAEASHVVFSSTKSLGVDPTLDISLWMSRMEEIVRHGDDWEVYSYVLVHLPSQLSNMALFEGDAEHVRLLHTVVLRHLQSASFHVPPTDTAVKKGDIALCLFHTLTVLVGYHEQLTRQQLHDTVKVFLAGIGMWDRAAKCCIHALTLCCYEIPVHVDKSLPYIVQKMSQMITQSHLAMDILEFLGGLVRLPDAYRSSNSDFLRTIFGICVRYLHHSWEQRQKTILEPSDPRASFSTMRYSGAPGNPSVSPDVCNAENNMKDLPEYVFALAYHVITYWFLAINIPERSKHVGWIAKNLAWKDNSGLEIMEEQSQVTLDMMHRTAYSDLGETMPDSNFSRDDGKTTQKTWLIGLSIVTIETFKDNGLSQITKRQASGTTHAIYQQNTAPLPPHHILPRAGSSSSGSAEAFNILPNHILLQQTSTITPMPIPMQPIILPDNESTKRAISTFDRNDTVDGHKAGVIFIGKGQSSEAEILSNTDGTALYDIFLAGLGTKVKLQGAKFNTQGLDRESNMDGTHTYAWRDRVTEIVFHVTTMMPTDSEHDPQCISKKRHIGNDFVNIIFNDSGLSFDFDTFKSQFNYVNIVITPELMGYPLRSYPIRDGVLEQSSTSRNMDEEDRSDPRYCFKVETLCSPSFPEISPAATPKIVSASALPGFVRQLAFNASVFSLVWSNREGGEHVSSWRNRLRQIIKLRERYANTSVSANVAYPEMGTAQDRGGARSYLEGDEWKGILAMGGLSEENQMLLSLDFTRWA